MRNDFSTDYLAHHGILGQKWGHQNGPPYPLDAKDHSSSEKKAGWMKSLKAKSDAKKRKKKQLAALEKARTARAEAAKQKRLKEEYEAKKQDVLKRGKASEVMKYKGQMTNQELNEALNRIRMEKQLATEVAAETRSGFDKIESIMDKARTVSGWMTTGKNIYNSLAEIHNTFSATSESEKWPKIGEENQTIKDAKETAKKEAQNQINYEKKKQQKG